MREGGLMEAKIISLLNFILTHYHNFACKWCVSEL